MSALKLFSKWNEAREEYSLYTQKFFKFLILNVGNILGIISPTTLGHYFWISYKVICVHFVCRLHVSLFNNYCICDIKRCAFRREIRSSKKNTDEKKSFVYGGSFDASFVLKIKFSSIYLKNCSQKQYT